MPDKKPPTTSICLSKESELTFSPTAISKIFKENFANLANNFHKRLPDLRRKFGIPSLRQYYKGFNLCGKKNKFQKGSSVSILNILQEFKTNKTLNQQKFKNNRMRMSYTSFSQVSEKSSFTQQTLACHKSMTKSQKLSILAGMVLYWFTKGIIYNWPQYFNQKMSFLDFNQAVHIISLKYKVCYHHRKSKFG